MLKNIPAFDANVGYGIDEVVEIVYSGVARSNKLYVYESDTNRLVIDGYENATDRLIIPPNRLTNSKSYYICVSITNINNEVTELSDYVFFTCYSTPSLYFNNVNDGDVIYTTSITASLTYIQPEDRELLSYRFYIYEYNQTTESYENTPMSSSSTYFDSTMSYTFKGLEANKTYYIRAVGDTVDGMIVDTGYYKVLVLYTQPGDSYYVMDVENYPVCGWIQYKTNVRIVEGKYGQILSKGNNDGLIDHKGSIFIVPYDFGEKTVSESIVDCRDGILVYDSGWAVPDDFSLRVNFFDMNLTDEDGYPCIRILDDNENDASVYLYRYDDDETFYRFKLVVKNNYKLDKNILNFNAWSATKATRGSVSYINNGIKLTATADDCYTNWQLADFPKSARVPIAYGETITLSWEEDTNTDGLVYIFPNGSTDGMIHVNNKIQKCISYTATEGVSFITFRFGVLRSGNTINYKNIAIRDGKYDNNYFLSNYSVKKYILYSPIIKPKVFPFSGSFSFNRKNNLYSLTAFNIDEGGD